MFRRKEKKGFYPDSSPSGIEATPKTDGFLNLTLFPQEAEAGEDQRVFDVASCLLQRVRGALKISRTVNFLTMVRYQKSARPKGFEFDRPPSDAGGGKSQRSSHYPEMKNQEYRMVPVQE
jgi:hypothetical protein